MNIEKFTEAPVHNQGRDSWLRFCIGQAPVDGHILEFGVWRGHSINVLAEAVPDRRVVGFDSFEGLPVSWPISAEKAYSAGHFSVDKIPDVRPNVQLIKGLFCDTIPSWLDATQGNISFLHIDSDLYESAWDILTLLDDRIAPGTVIVFDELADFQTEPTYPYWRIGEWLALRRWLLRYERNIEPICRTSGHAAAVRVIQ